MGIKSKGFTLIELMIVTAIVGVLVAVAVPLYHTSMLRAQVNQVVGGLAVYKTTYEINLAGKKAINNQTLSYVPSPYTSGNVGTQIATANADGSGHLQVTIGGTAHPSIVGAVVRYERSVEGVWSCVIDRSGASDWSARYMPPSCTML